MVPNLENQEALHGRITGSRNWTTEYAGCVEKRGYSSLYDILLMKMIDELLAEGYNKIPCKIIKLFGKNLVHV